MAVFLLFMMNDARLLSRAHLNGTPLNLLTGLVVFATLILGLTSIGRALGRAFGTVLVDERMIVLTAAAAALLLAWPVVQRMRVLRR